MLNRRDSAGNTPLLLVIQAGERIAAVHDSDELDEAENLDEVDADEAEAVVRLLLAKPAIDPHQKGPDGNTVLHYIEPLKKAKALLAIHEKKLDSDAFGRLADTANRCKAKPAAMAQGGAQQAAQPNS